MLKRWVYCTKKKGTWLSIRFQTCTLFGIRDVYLCRISQDILFQWQLNEVQPAFHHSWGLLKFRVSLLQVLSKYPTPYSVSLSVTVSAFAVILHALCASSLHIRRWLHFNRHCIAKNICFQDTVIFITRMSSSFQSFLSFSASFTLQWAWALVVFMEQRGLAPFNISRKLSCLGWFFFFFLEN